MERCATVAFDLAHINDLMLLVRDDVAMISRGVAVVPLRERQGRAATTTHEKVCIDFKDRRDFLHSIARNWSEVTWVAGGELSDAPRGARAVSRVFRRRVPGRRVQGRQGQQGSRRRGQPRARQVLGNLGQDDQARVCGSPRAARTSLMRTTPTLNCRILSRVRSRLMARCSVARWSRCRT